MKKISTKAIALLSAISCGALGFSPVMTQAASPETWYMVESPFEPVYRPPYFFNYSEAVECSKAQGPGYAVYKYNYENGKFSVIYVHGDVSDDNRIDLADVVMLRQCLRGKVELTQIQEEKADIDNNGVVNTKDFIALQNYYLNLNSYGIY